MANWFKTIDVAGVFASADSGAIDAKGVAKAILDGLRDVGEITLAPQSSIYNHLYEYAEQRRLSLIDDFEALVDDETLDFDELDVYLEELYDWGDLPLDIRGRTKVCWIKTI